MSIHVLPGDSLVGPFKETAIDGDFFVCRECLVDGDVSGEILDDFWKTREQFLRGYGDDGPNYRTYVVEELTAMKFAAAGNEVNLWFEYELFCQVNLWFTLTFLRDPETEFYVVYPQKEQGESIWDGFASLDQSRLKLSFKERVLVGEKDRELVSELWDSFRKRDWKHLKALGETKSDVFPTLKTVTEAAAVIETRPKESLNAIVKELGDDFGKVFREFGKREAVYGFGDLQVKRLMVEI